MFIGTPSCIIYSPSCTIYSMEMFHKIKISKSFENNVRWCLFLGPVSEQLPKIQFSTRHVPRFISWIIGKVWKYLNCRSIFCTKHSIPFLALFFFIKFKATVNGIRNAWHVLFPKVPYKNLSSIFLLSVQRGCKKRAKKLQKA